MILANFSRKARSIKRRKYCDWSQNIIYGFGCKFSPTYLNILRNNDLMKEKEELASKISLELSLEIPNISYSLLKNTDEIMIGEKNAIIQKDLVIFDPVTVKTNLVLGNNIKIGPINYQEFVDSYLDNLTFYEDKEFPDETEYYDVFLGEIMDKLSKSSNICDDYMDHNNCGKNGIETGIYLIGE